MTRQIDKPKLGAFDRLLLRLAPQWALRRLQARVAATALARHYGSYEAATQGRRTSGWWGRPGDANAAGGPNLERLRNLARDLRRNNGWAKRAVQVICNNTVGWGIRPRAISGSSALAARAMELWNGWADSKACDFSGRLTVYGMQRLAMACVVESGEVLVRRHRQARGAMGVPLKVQLLEPDYLATHLDGQKGASEGSWIVQGVEFDRAGQRVAYHLYTQHPGANRLFGNRYEIQRVDAEDILHVYLCERPEQVRGPSWLSAAMAKLHDFDEWEDASLMRQKIAACFAAFVSNVEGPVGAEDADDPLAETLEPGLISYLKPGQQIHFATPPVESGQEVFAKMQLHRIAAALGVTYEDLSSDYSQVNFSSARLARLSHWANVTDWQWNMLVPQLCDGLWAWAMDAAAIAGQFGDAEIALPSAEWTVPTMPMIEPDKEGLAYKRLMRAGMMTHPEALREQGRDPERWLAEQIEWNGKLDKAGIWLDSDPRRTSDAGLTQERAGGGGGGSAADTAKANAELSGASDG